MKSNYLFLFAGLLALIVSGCDWNDDDGLFSCIDGDGERIREELLIDDFSKIDLEISADVYITQGETQEVIVEGQQNVIHQIELDVDNDTWEIEFDGCTRDYDDLRFYITMVDIRELKITGSGMIYGENDFDVDELKLRISGSGDIDVALAECDRIDSRISGSGRIQLAGETEDFKLEISGSGDYRAFDLKGQDGMVEISGSGDAEVTTMDELYIEISGSGDVYYKGNPDLSIDISGSGDVIDAN